MSAEPEPDDDRYAEKNLIFRSPTAGGLLEYYKGYWFRHVVPCPPEYQKTAKPVPLENPDESRNGTGA